MVSTIHFAHGTSSNGGCAIITSKNTPLKFNNHICDQTGRFQILDVDINTQNYILVNAYAPTKDNPKEQKQFITTLKEKLTSYQEGNLIIAGDFNVCLNPTVDKSGGRNETPSDYAKLMISFMEEFDLIDIWRIRNPDTRRYTWRQRTKAGVVHSRLDILLVSLQLSYLVQESDIDIGICSDHSIINIALNKQIGEARGKSF